MIWKFLNRRSFLTGLGGLPLLAAPGRVGAAADRVRYDSRFRVVFEAPL